MKITEYLKTVEKIPAWDRIPAISDEELAEMILDAERFDTMDKPYGGAGVDMVRRHTMVKE